MKQKTLFFVSLITLALLFSFSIFAQNELISAKELAKIMNNKDVVIVSTRSAADYAMVHINGAVNIENKSLYKEGEVKSLIKSPEELANILGAKGINKEKIVVIHCNGKFIGAGRLLWILKYLGVKDVRILDGHLKGWRAARKPLTRVASKAKAVTFTPVVNKNILASKSYVKSKLNKPNVVIVDSRDKEAYDAGHIDGAINFDNLKILNLETAILKSKEELINIFKDAGITSDKEIILYCKSGERSGGVFFALQVCDYPNVKVYDGSYNEWK